MCWEVVSGTRPALAREAPRHRLLDGQRRDRARGGCAARAGRGRLPRLPGQRRRRGRARCDACHHGGRRAGGLRARTAGAPRHGKDGHASRAEWRGQAAKATNQIMCAGVIQAVAEAMAFARAEGLPLDKLIETLGKGAGSSWYFVNRAPNMVRGSFPAGFRVRLHEKDLRICRDMAARRGVQLPVDRDDAAALPEPHRAGITAMRTSRASTASRRRSSTQRNPASIRQPADHEPPGVRRSAAPAPSSICRTSARRRRCSPSC